MVCWPVVLQTHNLQPAQYYMPSGHSVHAQTELGQLIVLQPSATINVTTHGLVVHNIGTRHKALPPRGLRLQRSVILAQQIIMMGLMATERQKQVAMQTRQRHVHKTNVQSRQIVKQ